MLRESRLSVKKSNLHVSHHYFLVVVAGTDSSGSPGSPTVAPPRSLAEEKVVDVDIFQQGQEYEEQAHEDIDVNGLDASNVGEFIPHV